MIKHDKITIDESGIIKIVNWKRYQSEYRRLKKYRGPHISTGKSTEESTANSNSREGEGDRERDKKEIIKEGIYTLLIPVKGLGPDKAEKLTDFIVDELIPEFPEVDAIEQTRKKVTWWKDKPLTKESRPHAQMRTWFKKAQFWIDEAKAQDRVGSSQQQRKPHPKEKELQRLLQEAEKKVRKENPDKRGEALEILIRNARGKTSQDFWKDEGEKP